MKSKNCMLIAETSRRRAERIKKCVFPFALQKAPVQLFASQVFKQRLKTLLVL